MEKRIYAANALFNVAKVAVVDFHFKQKQVWRHSRPYCLALFLLSFLLTSLLYPMVRPPAETRGRTVFWAEFLETVDVRSKENQKEEDAWAGKRTELTPGPWCYEMLIT
ncbi:MAG: hypothetical protein U9N19_08595 [Thermodesulfobacteriota bacterium]|nr:hypothetical protein [Thermodesulfobacteriota bacterium]